jgi:hypothetical protein
MDQVKLSHFQIRSLAKQDVDVVITATNDDIIFVEPEKAVGEGKGKWMMPNGKWRKQGEDTTI